jgi:protein disulfide-isomerase
MKSQNFTRSRVLLLVLAITCFLGAGFAKAAELAWKTDFAQASAQAGQQHKYMLLDFTGSDWCPWCVKMDKEVFNQPQFSDFAGKNLVLVKLDFPRRAVQSAAEKSQNEGLAKKYGIEGFPTYILLDPNGKEVRRQVGYLEGGPDIFIDWMAIAGKTQG